MTKTVNGSFIVDCEVCSPLHRALDTYCPIYETQRGETYKSMCYTSRVCTI